MKVFNKQEFVKWLQRNTFTRKIKGIQMHHTWKPNYDHWNDNPDALYWCESMKRSHLKRGFSDIAQNITICPDGSIVVCRDFNTNPAGIKGKNTGYICVENIGDFDNDVMTEEQKDAILFVNAVMSIKFGYKISEETVLYHTWFASYKSCPGLNFFGGNTRESAIENFYPLIEKKITEIRRENEASN